MYHVILRRLPGLSVLLLGVGLSACGVAEISSAPAEVKIDVAEASVTEVVLSSVPKLCVPAGYPEKDCVMGPKSCANPSKWIPCKSGSCTPRAACGRRVCEPGGTQLAPQICHIEPGPGRDETQYRFTRCWYPNGESCTRVDNQVVPICGCAP